MDAADCESSYDKEIQERLKGRQSFPIDVAARTRSSCRTVKLLDGYPHNKTGIRLNGKELFPNGWMKMDEIAYCSLLLVRSTKNFCPLIPQPNVCYTLRARFVELGHGQRSRSDEAIKD